jgi:hypothetical protein
VGELGDDRVCDLIFEVVDWLFRVRLAKQSQCGWAVLWAGLRETLERVNGAVEGALQADFLSIVRSDRTAKIRAILQELS